MPARPGGGKSGGSGAASLTSFPPPSAGNPRILQLYEKTHGLIRWEPPKSETENKPAGPGPGGIHAPDGGAPQSFNYFYGNKANPNAPPDGEEEAPPNWMPNDKCLVCYECGVLFTMFRRKHHCRLCGHIVCGNCSTKSLNMRLVYPYTETGYARACDFCYNYFVELNPDLLLPGDATGGVVGAGGGISGNSGSGGGPDGAGGKPEGARDDEELDLIIAFARTEAERLRRAEVGPAGGLAALLATDSGGGGGGGGGIGDFWERQSRVRQQFTEQHKRIKLAWALHHSQNYDACVRA